MYILLTRIGLHINVLGTRKQGPSETEKTVKFEGDGGRLFGLFKLTTVVAGQPDNMLLGNLWWPSTPSGEGDSSIIYFTLQKSRSNAGTKEPTGSSDS